MFAFDDIYVYILNWKKVSVNALKLYDNITPLINNTIIINCDEFMSLTDYTRHIQLDDSHYYGSQFNHAIKHVKDGSIMCVIVGDNIPDNDFKKIFQNALDAYNNFNIGVYSPNDKRSHHRERYDRFNGELYDVPNTDCGFWFIHPNIVKKLRNLDFTITKYGWGIDIIFIAEARKQQLLVLRDYSVETDQLDRTIGYNTNLAAEGDREIKKEYNKLID
jgi:hypothetical protein